MIKMIVTDLDNTLLRRDKSISEYTAAVLKNCREKGIKIVFATARSTRSSSRFLDLFSPDIFIGYGGALALAGDAVICRFDIPADISRNLIERCLKTPEISRVYAINESAAHTNGPNPPGAASAHYQCIDFSRNHDTRYLKISLIAPDPGVVERIASEYPMLDLLRYTGEDLYRFANCNAVKWNAVKAAAQYCGICTDAVAAFGDDTNDLEMIQKCGIGIAVENAIDQVKAAAKYICEPNDKDGVAKWLAAHIV